MKLTKSISILSKIAIALTMATSAFSANACDVTTANGTCAYFTNTPTAEHVSWGSSEQTEVVEESTPFRCYPGSQCGYVEFSMGNSECKTTHVEVGFDYNLPLPSAYGVLDLSGTSSTTWEVCSNTSTTVGCTNTTPDTEVKAQIFNVKGWGTKKFTGNIGTYTPGKRGVCDLGGRYYDTFWIQNKCVGGGSATVTKTGWWPKDDYATCSAPQAF